MFDDLKTGHGVTSGQLVIKSRCLNESIKSKK